MLIKPMFFVNNTSKIQKLGFSGNIEVYGDFGASNPKGSAKSAIGLKNGKDYVAMSDVLPNNPQNKVVCPDGIKSEDDFLQHMSKFYANTLVCAKQKGIIKDKYSLSRFFISTPGIIGNKNNAICIANLRTPQGKSLQNVDFNKTVGYLKKQLDTANIKHSEDLKLVIVNDLVATSGAIADIMVNNPKFKEKYADKFQDGFYGVVAMTGGGFGVSTIKISNDKVKIESSESGSNEAVGSKESLEDYGASVPALIKNFAAEAGFDGAKIEALKKTGCGQIITQFKIGVDKDSREYKALKDTNLFEETNENGKILMQLKGIDEQKHAAASKKAVNKYIDAAAQLASVKVNEGANLYILTGPLAASIKKHVNQNPKVYEKEYEQKTQELINKNAENQDKEEFKAKYLEKLNDKCLFDKLFMVNTMLHLNRIGMGQLNNNNFDLETDIQIKDNTLGGRALLRSESSGGNLRSGWREIEIQDLIKDKKQLELHKIKKIKLSKDDTDGTIKGYFQETEVNEYKAPKSIEIKGKKVKLPDLNNPDDCCDWWERNIGKAPLNTKDKERARILREIPSKARERIVANLSQKGKQLTEYDNPELIKYRLDLNNRRIAIETKEVKTTPKAQFIIDAVSNEIFDNYKNSQRGIDKDKKLIVMLGQKASGKTTLVNKMREKYGVVVADSDEIRDKIGYQETELHGRLKFSIKQKLEDKAIEQGANYLAQVHGTGVSGTVKLINKFKEAGYDVIVQNIEVPEEKLVERIQTRKERTGKDADPLSVIICGHNEQLDNFRSIVEQADIPQKNAKRYNNDVPYGQAPELIKEAQINSFKKAA